MKDFIEAIGVLPIALWLLSGVLYVAWRSITENREIEEMSHGPRIVAMLHNELRMAREELDSLESDEPGYFMAQGAVTALQRARIQASAISEGF